MGINMTLGKENNLSIVILCFDSLMPFKVILNPSKKLSETYILNDNGYIPSGVSPDNANLYCFIYRATAEK
ncbi:MAG: hypothetical protein ACI971_002323 [Colwellia sp.]|jgi:hypothetical protein